MQQRLLSLLSLWVATGLLWLPGCGSSEEEDKQTYLAYCGSCHLAPDPAQLSKELWASHVLPEMAARMGLSINGYNPMSTLAWQEKTLVAQLDVYPAEPLLPVRIYEQIHQYILRHAPEALPAIPERNYMPVSAFTASPIALDQRPGGMTTFVGFDEQSGNFLAGNAIGDLFRVGTQGVDSFAKGLSPIVGWSGSGSEGLMIDVGILAPTELREGRLWQVKGGKSLPMRQGLHRPVNVLWEDLDGDGTKEIAICEYGYFQGKLTLLHQDSAGNWQERTLLPLPGTTRVLVRDMNQDGKKDLVVVHGQGNEGVHILYQEEDLAFRPVQVIKENPLYGTSWMELVDYDLDGDLDMILAQGDNGDYSYALKPYHGIRIYLNEGNNQMKEAFFFPLFGATRVLAQDFDQDGDIDLAVSAYFPDFHQGAEASFVYLQNQNSAAYSFQPQTLDMGAAGRWMTSVAGDYDGDGDLDILLGSLTHTPTPVPPSILDPWMENNVDLLLLTNQLRGSSSTTR